MPTATAPTGSREFEGKTIEQATESACKHFSLPAEELDIEIINKGSSGIFGLGGRKAKIRAVPKCHTPKTPKKPPEEIPAETPLEKPKRKPLSETSRPRNKRSRPAEGQPIETFAGASAKAAETRPGTSSRASHPAPSLVDIPHMHAAREITEGLLKKMGLECAVELKNEESGAKIEITGQDTAIAIGHEGKTLEAIEYLVNRAIAKRFEGEGTFTIATIPIDAGGFRSNREDFLVKLAHSKAEQVRKTGRPVVLAPMNPAERRLIHLTLKDAEGIRTASTGTGTMRKIAIVPANRLPRGPRRASSQRPGVADDPIHDMDHDLKQEKEE